jgi:3-(3-hydroxy-phenyl)propionate hydroxylase
MLQAEEKAKTRFGYRRHADQDLQGDNIAEYPVVVVGAGPVGLSLAIDLAQRGQAVVLLDDADRIGEGSRAICFSKRSLEYWDRLGIGQRMVEKGVVWSVGRIFHGESLLYQFNLLPEQGHKRPAFINLQQFHAEAYLVDRVGQLPGIDLRWCNKVVGLQQRNDRVVLTVDTPEGPYRLQARYVIACDGARSSLRHMAGAAFSGQVFEDQFLIADVRMTAAFPTERWFWFDPPFHAGRSALLHKQPDDVWRIDLQLHPDADPAVEKRPENVRPRIARMLGHDQFDFEWISLYKFQCRRMDRFVHGRVIFAGDAAHQVSPFGARGANSGLEDAENLAWKLDRVLRGQSPDTLLESYHAERSAAADENIRESTRATDFMAPATRQEARLRKAVLSLAKETEFGKRMVNGGRLSVPSMTRRC